MDVQDYLRRVKPQIKADEIKTIIKKKKLKLDNMLSKTGENL